MSPLIRVNFFSYLAPDDIKFHIQTFLTRFGHKYQIDTQNFEYLIVLGGDGTLISALKQYHNQNIKIISLNFGNLGFLTTSSNNWDILHDLNVLKYKNYSLLHALDDHQSEYFAVNELLFYTDNNPIPFNVNINGEKLYSYCGSGFLASTPNGSTGLSRSYNGPIILNDCFNYLFSEYLPVKTINNSFLGQFIVLKKEDELSINYCLNTNNFAYLKADGINTKINSENIKIKMVLSMAQIATNPASDTFSRIRTKIIGN